MVFTGFLVIPNYEPPCLMGIVCNLYMGIVCNLCIEVGTISFSKNHRCCLHMLLHLGHWSPGLFCLGVDRNHSQGKPHSIPFPTPNQRTSKKNPT